MKILEFLGIQPTYKLWACGPVGMSVNWQKKVRASTQIKAQLLILVLRKEWVIGSSNEIGEFKPEMEKWHVLDASNTVR